LAGSSLDQLQIALGTSYTIERELGRGGMATVYLARDTKHQRPVALKVLQPDLAATLGPERFRREIATVAQLQHPHILGVHDSGETPDGQLWFTMPYVEGESLRARLEREQQLPIEDALRITREIAGALDYAHDAGVIHRDIKPENILLTRRGDALLADFGIARVLSDGAPDSGAPRAGLTMTGLAVGTPQYMSPEQASGDRMLDARSDLYALAAVYYEMLAGEPPFSGPSQQAIVAKMLTTEAPSVRVLRPGVSPAMDAVLARALARTPADRWPGAGEFARALSAAEQASHASAATMTSPATTPRPSGSVDASRRKMPVATLALVLGFLIGAGLLFAWRSKSSSGAAADATSPSGVRLAVLPFDNLGDTADAYFADGVTDAVRGKLTGIAGLGVIGSNSSGQYRHTTKTAQQIGEELGVRYLLIGKVRWAKGPNGSSRVQVSPELVDTKTAQDTWAEPFNAPITDVFQVQADIADKVAQKLQIALTPAAQQTIADKPTKDVVAYDAYLRGMEILRVGGPQSTAYRRSNALFREAVQRDSTFASAWAQISINYGNLFLDGVTDAGLADSSDVTSARALAWAPGLAVSHRARAAYYKSVLGDPTRGIAESEAALALEPRNPRTLASLASDEVGLSRWDAAIGHYQQGLQLDPRDLGGWISLGETQMRLHHVSEAKASFARAAALQPHRIDLNQDQVTLALMQGDMASARAFIASMIQATDSTSVVTYLATYDDYGWVLDSAETRHLLTLGSSAFDGDRAQWAFSRAEQFATMNDRGRMRIWADTARIEYEAQLKQYPGDPQRVVDHAIALAYLGRKAEAMAEGMRAVTLAPVAKNAIIGPYVQHQLLRVYLALGENDVAMDQIEKLLPIPYFLSAPRMRIDPEFSALKGNPRFEKILAAAKPLS